MHDRTLDTINASTSLFLNCKSIAGMYFKADDSSASNKIAGLQSAEIVSPFCSFVHAGAMTCSVLESVLV